MLTNARPRHTPQTVDRVIIPGAEGVYGVTAGHTPIVSQLKPGVVEIVHEAAGEAEKYFVSGGFALTHDTSVTVSFGTTPLHLARATCLKPANWCAGAVVVIGCRQ